MNKPSQGRLIIVSGPAGAGKSTVVRQLIDTSPLPIVPSVSATTRPPRAGEEDRVHYHFLSDEEFAKRREQGEMLESFEVFDFGYWYGTLKSEVTTGLCAGKWVLLEIDVHGAMSVVEQHPDAITIFILPPSMDELEQRLRGRGTETEEAVTRRLEVAKREMELADRYQYQVVNDNVDRAVCEIIDILTRIGENSA